LPRYAGDLLAGFDDAGSVAWTSWLGFERDRLRTAWRGAVLQRAAGEIDAGEAVALTGRLLEADPARRRPSACNCRAGARAARGRARQVYRAFATRLRKTLGLAPGAPELQALHNSLVGAGAADAPRPPPVAEAAAGTTASSAGRSNDDASPRCSVRATAA
jgi:DNA-binding SARP family transcriptional activator